MATINKGEADRSILNTVGIPDKFVDKTDDDKKIKAPPGGRSEEHTSELQSATSRMPSSA